MGLHDVSTTGLAARYLVFSFSEWVMCDRPTHCRLGSIREWAGVFPDFPLEFDSRGDSILCLQLLLVMLHVRNREKDKKYSGSLQTDSWKTHKMECWEESLTCF